MKEVRKIYYGEIDNNLIIKQIPTWLKKKRYDYLKCAIHGSYSKNNIELLNTITIAINNRLESLSDEKNKTKEKDCLIQLLKEAIYYLTEAETKNHQSNSLLEKLIESNNREIRLYCCGSVSNYDKYMNNPDERMRKIVQIRKQFEENWNNQIQENDKKIIEYLLFAINMGNITYLKRTSISAEGKILISFLSQFFEYNEVIFDEDICDNIKDKRILACELYRLIQEEKIKITNQFYDYMKYTHTKIKIKNRGIKNENSTIKRFKSKKINSSNYEK